MRIRQLTKYLTRAFLLFVIVFSIFEITLRIKGSSTFYGKLLKDEIKFYAPFIINENGSFSHNPDIINDLRDLRNTNDKSLNQLYTSIVASDIDLTDKYMKVSYLAQIENLTIDSVDVEKGHYSFLYNGIKKDLFNGGYLDYKTKVMESISIENEPGFADAVWKFMIESINSDGFRSIEMKPFETDRKKILLLGDSYAYGYTAIPVHNCFADQLLLDGNVVYNTGIPGTNCLNYLNNAKSYIESLKPDYVLTFLYLQNDIVQVDLDNEFGFIPYHATNSGWHSTTIGIDYYPEQEEWLKALKKNNNVKEDGLFISRTATFQFFKNRKAESILRNDDNKYFEKYDFGLTNQYLLKIDSICKTNDAISKFIIIPTCKGEENQIIRDSGKVLFKGLSINSPDNFVESDFRCNEGDEHFNNSGHQKMKDYIDKLIEL